MHLRTTGPSHKVLNTITTAAGVRKPNGAPIDNFGDPTDPGVIPEMIA